MKKFALGIHPVNVAYTAGNIDSYHRQVREGIGPLLNLLLRHPNWCFNVQMNGYSIEFIANHYPEILELIKSLINKWIYRIKLTPRKGYGSEGLKCL
jgi:hypothetical protein